MPGGILPRVLFEHQTAPTLLVPALPSGDQRGQIENSERHLRLDTGYNSDTDNPYS